MQGLWCNHENYRVINMVSCKRCHRTLKNPVSIVHGYGPSCYKKALKEMKPSEIDDSELLGDNKVYMSMKQ